MGGDYYWERGTQSFPSVTIYYEKLKLLFFNERT